jgi:acyl-CoA synthetase (AMP-forming)/AMP-acid ligase II/acyl carrier protein
VGNELSVVRNPPIPFLCIPDVLKHQARRIPNAPAILAPGRAPLTYDLLNRHIQNSGLVLRAIGIGRHDRVALVLPNGPEMATAALTVEANATCVPMNRAFHAEEFEKYFSDLQPRALIIEAGIESPARIVALSRGMRVIELSPALDAEAGLFTLHGDSEIAPDDEAASPDQVAVLLPTSGTTSRPKIVAQTHANICVSAFSSVAALALSESDRCLNIMPLFHGHGLHATLLASLSAGASVVCTVGLDVDRFGAWLKAFQPTWYSGVPTMHQAILTQARPVREQIAECRLRFIRSSSGPLPTRLFAELERTFNAPVIDYYGMTEVASTPIACSPLPPRRRKAGSVGVRVGLDVAIMGDGGALLPNGQTGQVVVRGRGVMAGYDADPAATESAFLNGWFKTGDLGYFDDDDYLFLTGRTREVVNRGGEKILPREVDEVLLEHPAVVEAVAFGVPHPSLGEEVAAAVVLRPRAEATVRDIRQFAMARLADFKVPRRVLIVSAIPKGPTGKIRRLGLAAELGLATGAAAVSDGTAPRTPVEKQLSELWAELLGLDRVGINDDFFTLGGDSLMATHAVVAIHEKFDVEIDVSRFFDEPTVAAVARQVERMSGAGRTGRTASAIVGAHRKNGVAPASSAQERLWKLHQALPDIPFFNILYALRLRSRLDLATLERSINEIVRRHEILRTTLAIIDGKCEQVIAQHLTVPLQFHDLRPLPRSEKGNCGHGLVREEALRPFDLTKGPLLRARLLRLEKREHLLLISMHQAVCDGWSLGVFVEELLAIYDAFSARRGSPLPPLPIHYADFAHWQREWQSYPEIAAQLAYWRERLRGPLPPMQLTTSRPERPIDNLRMARREWKLPRNLSEAAKRFANREGSTLFMALVAALNTLLHHYLDQDDVRVATNVANRNRPGSEGLIGPLVNTVILRTNLAGDPSAQEAMHRVRSSAFAAYANQDLPIEYLAEVLEREYGLEPSALASVMILLQNEILRPLVGMGDELTVEEANANMLMPVVTLTTFDIILMLREGPDGLLGTCAYKPKLFTAEAIDCMLRDFEKVLDHMVARPSLPISAIRVGEWTR